MSESTPYAQGTVFGPYIPAACDPNANLDLFEDFQHPGCDFDPVFWSNIGPDRPPGDTGHNPPVYIPNTVYPRFDIPNAGADNPPSGSLCSIRYQHLLGDVDTTPAQVTKFETFAARYVEWYEYYETPWIWPPGQKLARFFDTAGLNTQLQYQINTDGAGNQSLTFFATDIANGTVWDNGGNPNTAIAPLALDTWHQMAIYYRQSTGPGVPDGRFTLWLNNVIIVDSGPGGVATQLPGGGPSNGWWVGGNHTWTPGTGPGGHTSAPQDQARYIADVNIHSEVPCNVVLP